MDGKWVVNPIVTPMQDPKTEALAGTFMYQFTRRMGDALWDVIMDQDGLVWVEVDTPTKYDARYIGGSLGLFHRWTSGTGAPGRSHVVFGFTPIPGDFDPIPEAQGRVL